MRVLPLGSKRPIAGVLSLSILTLALALPASAQVENVQEIFLDNGMKVLLYPRQGDPNVAAGWIAHVGSVNERPGITGMAHLFEHMMFKGTDVIGTKDIDEDLAIIKELDQIRGEMQREQRRLDTAERRGEIEDASVPEARTARHQELRTRFEELLARQKELLVDNEFDKLYSAQGATGMNAGTSNDFTVYFINLPANKLELWFWMESDRLANPVFRQFYSERDVVWEERRMRVDSTPTGRLDEEFDALFWKASPYSWPVIGWPSDLDTITREEALAFYDRNYSPNNLTAALVGDFDPAHAKRLAEKYFGRLKRSRFEPTPVRTFEPEQEMVKRFEGEAETRPTIRVRWHGVPHGHVDAPALEALSSIMNGRTGRLYRSLVEDQGIASDASAGVESRKYGGFVQLVGVAADGYTPEDVEAALYAELEKLQNEPVAERELQKVKNQTLAGNWRRLDGNFLIMIQLLIYDDARDWRDMFTESDKLLAVTTADVQRVAKKYFPMDGRSIAVYRTKEKDENAPADPLWDALNAQQQQMASAMKAQMASVTDPAQLEAALGQIAAGKSQAPPEVQPVLAWAESFVQRKLAELRGGDS
ncbi:MAG: pitrilysin family protein [Acidobacteriota bacterium]